VYLRIFFIIYIIVVSLTPESVRWLRVKYRIHEAEAILERVARVNNYEIPSGTILSSLPTSNAISTVIQCYAW